MPRFAEPDLAAARHAYARGPVSLSLEAPPDFDALLDRCIRETPGDTSRIPYYAALWPAARALADALVDRAADLAGRTVIELGCGLALPSLVAARLGATVLATDGHEEAGTWLARNARAQGLAVGWRCLDWSADLPPPGTYDLVIGSDLVYEPDAVTPLAEAVTRLAAHNGRFLIADPGRDPFPRLAEAFAALGWQTACDVVADCFVVEGWRDLSP